MGEGLGKSLSIAAYYCVAGAIAARASLGAGISIDLGVFKNVKGGVFNSNGGLNVCSSHLPRGLMRWGSELLRGQADLLID